MNRRGFVGCLAGVFGLIFGKRQEASRPLRRPTPRRSPCKPGRIVCHECRVVEEDEAWTVAVYGVAADGTPILYKTITFTGAD